MNEVTGGIGSGHNQRRFRHHSLTGTVKHGASINSTLCRPCACAMTPQAGQPITSGRTDSTSTRSPASSRWTPTT